MNAPNTAMPETPLQKEWQTFKEHFERVIDIFLNRMFDLKPWSARRRAARLVFLFLLAGFIVGLNPYPFSEWWDRIGQVLLSLFGRGQVDLITAIHKLMETGLYTFFNPYTLWFIPAFLIPFFIAQQAASFYLADIFELQNVGIARKFIWQVALTGSEDVIRFSAGEILSEHLDSPIYQIGGPGKIIVDLDTVVLFEKADGHPNVIGPTGKEPGGKATLDGFERFRQAIDLRDHFIDLRDQDNKSPSVKGRSLDGVPVTATDVRLMYSIYRGDKSQATPEMPYPFIKKSIEHLVYKSTSKVTPDQQYPSAYQFKGLDAMVGTVRGELGGFMAQKKLTEYLASIGEPEVKKAREQEDKVTREAVNAIPPRLDDVPDPKTVPDPPAFTPRYKITNDLFSQFAKKFTEGAKEKGVELHWIGIGTWKVPVEIVSERHLEAWKLNRENFGKGSDEAIKKLQEEAGLQKLVTMIQGVPIMPYANLSGDSANHDEALKSLLREYQKQLRDNFETLSKAGKKIKVSLTAAIFYIYKAITPSHSVYPPPPPPQTPHERELYDELMQKIRSHEVIEQQIELERRFAPHASREELLEQINIEWDAETR